MRIRSHRIRLALIMICLGTLVNSGCHKKPSEPEFRNILDPNGDFDDVPPLAVFAAIPDSGVTNETVFQFDASSSVEQDRPETALLFRWDFDNNGFWDTTESTSAQVTHKFSIGGGEKKVKLQVKGGRGLISDTIKIVFVNSRPQSRMTWTEDLDNEHLIFFDASGSIDFEDGSTLSFRWDFHNDGTWDIDWTTDAGTQHEFAGSNWDTKLQVRDAQGLISETAASAPIRAPLVAYYPFNGNANDQSENRSQSSVHNATLTADRFGNPEGAYSFNGRDSYIDIGPLDQLRESTKLTISIWVKKQQANRVEGFVGKWKTSGQGVKDNVFLLYNGEQQTLNRPRFLIQFEDGSAGRRVSTVRTLPVDEWTHLAATWQSSDGFTAIYMNGVLEDSTRTGMGRKLYYHELYNARIGHWGSPDVGDDRYLLGCVDEVRIYNRALSEEEITDLFTKGN